MSFLKKIKVIVSLVFPNRCAFCGKIIRADQMICEQCAAGLPLVEGEICPICGRGRAYCRCRKKSYCFDRCVAPFYYEGSAKRGVMRLKFFGKTAAAGAFAQFAAQLVRREYPSVPFDLVAAVPLSRAEIKNRGYNQSALFGRALADVLKLQYCEIIVKPYDTKPQRQCSGAARWGNVFGAFSVSGEAQVEGKTILLADDVMTTGATLNECAKILKLSGAAGVYCVVMACVKKSGETFK